MTSPKHLVQMFKWFTCVDGGQRLLKCHALIANYCAGLLETNDVRAIKHVHRQRAHIIAVKSVSAVLLVTIDVHCVVFSMGFASYIQHLLSKPRQGNKACFLDGGEPAKANGKRHGTIHHTTCTTQVSWKHRNSEAVFLSTAQLWASAFFTPWHLQAAKRLQCQICFLRLIWKLMQFWPAQGNDAYSHPSEQGKLTQSTFSGWYEATHGS